MHRNYSYKNGRTGTIANYNDNVVVGFQRTLVFISSMITIFMIGMKCYKNPIRSLKALILLMIRRKKIYGEFKVKKYYKCENKYYFGLNAPAYPSKGFDNFIMDEFNRAMQFDKSLHYMNTVIFSITNQCDYRCKHCFEVNNLQKEEHLSIAELKIIRDKLQTHGTLQIQLSGGEPIKRMDAVEELIRTGQHDIDYWLLTSGKDLDMDVALKLKRSGLVGVNISLDHFDANKHNDFRNHENAYSCVIEAIRNCKRVGLLTSLSLCATKEFVSEQNLRLYYELSKDLGVHFVQILEARSVGNFVDLDVDLEDKHIDILRSFYLDAIKNYDNEYPILSYPGYHQRKIGCMGAGDRYIYVDSRGKIHACPFCQTAIGDAVTDELDDSIRKLKRIGCHKH